MSDDWGWEWNEREEEATVSDELRPCPFCGSRNAKESETGVWCYDCCCEILEPSPGSPLFQSSGPHPEPGTLAGKAWNNAYCWRRIDELEAENKHLRQRLEDARERLLKERARL